MKDELLSFRVQRSGFNRCGRRQSPTF